MTPTFDEATAWRVTIRLVTAKGIPASVAVSEVANARLGRGLTSQVARALEVVRAKQRGENIE